LITGTGGGYGDPLDRPVETVQADVRSGYTTLEHAKQAYGVTLAPEIFEILTLDSARENRGRPESDEVHK
jgi:N-methylhydantoinase B